MLKGNGIFRRLLLMQLYITASILSNGKLLVQINQFSLKSFCDV